MQIFGRVYYAIAGLTLAAAACLPWLVPLSYQALGYPLTLVDSGTYEAFQAHQSTLSLRHQFFIGLLWLALALGALSLTALILRTLHRIDLPWLVMAVTTVASVGLAMMAIGGLTASICC